MASATDTQSVNNQGTVTLARP